MSLKRIIAFFTILSVLLGMSIVIPAAAQYDMVILSVDNISGKAGDEVEVAVSIENNPGLVGFMLNIKYDDAKMQPTDVVFEEAYSSALMNMFNLNYTKNQVAVLWMLADDNAVKGDGVLFTVKFVLAEDVENAEFFLSAKNNEFIGPNDTALKTNVDEISLDEVKSVTAGNDINFTGTARVPIDTLSVLLLNPDGSNIPGFVTDTGNGGFSVRISAYTINPGTYKINIYRNGNILAASTSVILNEGALPSGKYNVTVSATFGGNAKIVLTDTHTNIAQFAPGERVELVAALLNLDSGEGVYEFAGWESSSPVEFSSQDIFSSFIMPAGNVAITAKFRLVGSQPQPSYPHDIEGHWCEPYAKVVIDNKIMQGYPDNTFQPDRKLTRAEFATAMVNYLGLTVIEGKIFEDTADSWAKDYISTLVNAGVVSGYDENTFGTYDLITREQIAVILFRAFSPAISEDSYRFADHDGISSWAVNEVYAIRSAGWMIGDDTGFRPAEGATRAEISAILARLFEAGIK